MSLDQQHWTVDPNDLHASNGMDLFEEFAPEPTAVRRANPTDSFTSMPLGSQQPPARQQDREAQLRSALDAFRGLPQEDMRGTMAEGANADVFLSDAEIEALTRKVQSHFGDFWERVRAEMKEKGCHLWPVCEIIKRYQDRHPSAVPASTDRSGA